MHDPFCSKKQSSHSPLAPAEAPHGHIPSVMTVSLPNLASASSFRARRPFLSKLRMCSMHFPTSVESETPHDPSLTTRQLASSSISLIWRLSGSSQPRMRPAQVEAIWIASGFPSSSFSRSLSCTQMLWARVIAALQTSAAL